jgi:hypothetical protein
MVTDRNEMMPPEEKTWRYETFKIVDERCFCKTCKRHVNVRSFDGNCYACHVTLSRCLGHQPCPPFPVGQ